MQHSKKIQSTDLLNFTAFNWVAVNDLYACVKTYSSLFYVIHITVKYYIHDYYSLEKLH